MSAGHGDIDTRGLSAITINRLLENRDIKRRLYGFHKISDEYDMPYLGGYSEDGLTIYIDRHFPKSLTINTDGYNKPFNAIPHIVDHEAFEKAVMDVLGWLFAHAHEAANGYERRGVLKAGLYWGPYNKALDPYIKADEHERLVKLPPDLDMKPYISPPVNKKLLAHMLAKMRK